MARRNQSQLSTQHEQAFICINCQQLVTCSPLAAGVQNRNHCPCCLWSRHLDWRNAGDRLSPCRKAMEPIGLTTKRGRNKYAQGPDGELMVIHRCAGCTEIVINRIAADDHPASLLELFESSCAPGNALQFELAAMGLALLTARDKELVHVRLFGVSAPANRHQQ